MHVTDGKQFAAYMRTVRKRTADVVSKVPTEKHHWRLGEDSMSIVDIVLHIAAVEKALWGSDLIHRRPGTLEEFPKDKLSLEQALSYMSKTRVDSIAFWSNLTSENLDEEVMTPTGDTVALKRWLVLAAEHEIHHRGFIHAYRKIWGLATSPIYGLTLDQLRNLLK